MMCEKCRKVGNWFAVIGMAGILVLFSSVEGTSMYHSGKCIWTQKRQHPFTVRPGDKIKYNYAGMTFEDKPLEYYFFL
jgi:hypothetical protein